MLRYSCFVRRVGLNEEQTLRACSIGPNFQNGIARVNTIIDFDLVKLVSTIEPKLPKIEAFVLSSTPRPSPSVWCNRDLRLQDRPCPSSCKTRTFNIELARIFCITPSSIGPPSDTSIVYIFCTCRNESLAGCLSGSLCLSSQHGRS